MNTGTTAPHRPTVTEAGNGMMSYPPPPPVYEVCPHCKRQATRYSQSIPQKSEAYYCPVHGEVAPMRSAIVNRHLELNWVAA